jgi:hypothetical protein
MAASKNKLIFSCIVSFSILFSSSSHAAGLNPDSYKAKYYVILFGFVFFLPEIVELDFSDNGTFSLSSDLWDEPAEGTYEKNSLLLKGEGTTGKFFDVDFEEEIEISYDFVGLPIGLRGVFMMGIGSRDLIFEDGLEIPEPFIFEGFGF